MAKRFTDTNIEKDPWFRRLPPKLKVLFRYMKDDCDHAGIWKEDFDLFELRYGFQVTHEDMALFGDKVKRVDDESYYLAGFTKFQYGEMRENNSVHVSVAQILSKYGIHVELETGPSNSPKAILARLSGRKKMELMALDYFKCTYCGMHGDEHSLIIDHIIPRSKGGENHESNLTTACVSCNSKKSDLDVDVFISRHSLSDSVSEKLKAKLLLNSSQKAPINPLNGVMDMVTDKDMETVQDSDEDKEITDANQIIKIFNEICSGQGKIRKYEAFFLPANSTADLMNHLRMPRFRKESAWREAFREILKSTYLMGTRKQKSIICTLPWILKSDNFHVLIGGGFDNSDETEAPSKAESMGLNAEANAVIDKIVRNGKYQFAETRKELTDWQLDALQDIGGLGSILDCQDNFALEQSKKRYQEAFKKRKVEHEKK